MNDLFRNFQDGYNQGVSEFESDPKNPLNILKLILGIIVILVIILEFNGVPVFHYISVVWHWFAG